ncbi:ABC transporter ATP-binding protein [Blastococcus sp. CT_GayMR19]|uniref:ABC transporter ATP-binding protein n=1 Tax=Blastococcus sp. CT_GayMR19 TaxID=2559608 RepID=UPI001ADD6B65|nr:ABC transporter ATP-binding protein [Blastococcus sp. CT_GayMR19]
MSPGPVPASRLRALRETGIRWKQFWPFLGASPRRLLLLAGGSVLAGLLEAALLALVATLASALSQGVSVVDAVPGPVEATASLRTLFLVGSALALVRAALQVWLAHLPAVMSAQVMAHLRRVLFERFTRTSWSVQAAERDGYFQSLMATHVSHASLAITRLSAGITAVLMFLTLLASAFFLSVTTALVLISASVGLFLLLAPLSRRLRKHVRELVAENEEFSKGVHEIVQMAEEIQVFGASEAYRSQVDQLIQHVRRPLQQTRFLTRAVPGLYQSMAFLLLILALAVVYFSGATAIASLAAVVLILIRSLTYGQQIQTATTGLNELIPYMTRLSEALEEYAAHPQVDGAQPLGRVERLGMSDVHFAYEADRTVLRGVSFEARRGEAIGIVGPSGAGKSSLVQLMLRLREPTRGALEVNGQDATAFVRADWQRRISYVPQSPQLIWGTVAENIRFYRPEISDAEVEQAARRAHIHDEILSWPEGYRTVVGPRASAVSGGQRQRLCLARALAGNPDVLILDEPTSALDVRSEQAVQESLAEVKEDVLLFLVAHRLSTLSICDRVMVIVDGRLQAIDEPGALLEGNDFFREVSDITLRQAAR